MNLSCVQCREQLPITATFCNSCGRPVDADKDGVPDALGNMIEAKARAIVAEEQRLRDEAVERTKAAATLQKLEADAAELEKQIAQNTRLPRSWPGAFLHLWVTTAVMVTMFWLVFGVLIHLFFFGAIGVSPAGAALCSSMCEGCSGPGRVYSYNYKGPWHSENGRMGYALVCHNREFDIEKITTSEVRGEMNAQLQPYMMGGFTSFFLEGLILATSIGFLSGLRFAHSRRRVYDAKLTAMQRELVRNQAARGALGAPVAETTTFRS